MVQSGGGGAPSPSGLNVTFGGSPLPVGESFLFGFYTNHHLILHPPPAHRFSGVRSIVQGTTSLTLPRGANPGLLPHVMFSLVLSAPPRYVP